MKALVRHIGFLGVFMLALLLASCGGQQVLDVDSMLTKIDSTANKKKLDCQVTDVIFSDDYKYMDIKFKLNQGTGVLELSDTAAVDVRVSQKVGLTRGVMVNDSRPPILLGISNIAKEEIARTRAELLMLVDLNMPQSVIDMERDAVLQARTLMNYNQLYVAFMQGEQVSETYEATDYVIENYFKQHEAPNAYLYRSVHTKLLEMADSTSCFYDALHKGMIVLTSGKTYVDDKPIDPRHFEIQQQLIDMLPQLQEEEIWISYSLFTDDSLAPLAADAGQQEQNSPELGVLRLLVTQTDGLAQNSFDWATMREVFTKAHEIDYDDYYVSFMMPISKVFRGNKMELMIDFINRNTSEVITSCKANYSIGSVFYPIIVGDRNLIDVLLQGIVVGALLFLAVWLALQMVVPWVRYQLFLRHHVLRYTGAQMSKDGQMLEETCYLCKAPFEVGDDVVAKCQHVMHKECWDENNYHCPEYGRNCKHGSHYYNQNNLLDYRNATFFMMWVLAGILAGLLAWVFFLIRMHLFDNSFLSNILLFVFGYKSGTIDADRFLSAYAVHLDYQPAFGMWVSFFVTFMLSLITVRNFRWKQRLTNVFLRALIAGVLGCLFFILNCVFAVLMDIRTNSMLLDGVTWVFLVASIMYCVTWNTRVPIRPLWFVIACLLGIVSMYIWMLFYHEWMVDFRLFLLLSFLFTSIVLAICIAFEAPKSEHYFLQTQGAIKPMDIALYKWLRVNPSAVVTLGQSVDCSIHISWDMSGNVAPVHAELFHKHHSIWLKALEDGMLFRNKPMKAGDSEPLCHGSSFTIGNTTFTYVEKDL